MNKIFRRRGSFCRGLHKSKLNGGATRLNIIDGSQESNPGETKPKGKRQGIYLNFQGEEPPKERFKEPCRRRVPQGRPKRKGLVHRRA